MNVTLQYFEACPSWRVAADHLKTMQSEFDLTVVHELVETPEAAEQARFHGSPSFVMNGVDLFSATDANVGFACRVYQTPDGPAGSPTIDQIRTALTRAV
jgi:hypothetical protein